jgi:osmotically-inducible protein OsmY
VRSVSNDIHVVLPPREDQMIRDEVKVIFLRSPPLAPTNIEVAVDRGAVILTGMVGSAYRKQMAEALAESVTGVHGVENKLRVNHLAPRSDRDIQLDVASRLEWDPGLVDPQVSVKVSGGIVRLAGTVESSRAKERAIQDARVAGVKAVEANGLAIWEETPAAVGGASSGQ